MTKSTTPVPPRRSVPALKVRQWLPAWDKVKFDPSEYRSEPPHHFYMFTLPAKELRRLAGVMRRSTKGVQARTEDLAIQRQHDPERSEEISRFVEFGFPWSTLSKAKRESAEFNDLRKPGWLPTAVVVNILKPGDKRAGFAVARDDVVFIEDVGAQAKVTLPYPDGNTGWRPKEAAPFQVIDGQHRLWAFDDTSEFDNYDIPIVAFVGLDVSWQAYLFWTINIKPQRINPSLAFDLYPLLRSENWLEREDNHLVYRETRAQELTEILWSHPDSAWYDKINMLGETGTVWVAQSAWIKSLTASVVRPWEGRGSAPGGLFGGRSSKIEEVLGWSRAQQAAFLIFAWNSLRDAVHAARLTWSAKLRSGKGVDDPRLTGLDLAFYGSHSLISTDQGVRAYLQVVNDLCYVRATALKLNEWRPDDEGSQDPVPSVTQALGTFKAQKFVAFVQTIATRLAQFDWRSSAAELEEEERRAKLVFRGSGGYKELRKQLLEHLAKGDDDIADAARKLKDV